MRVSANRNEKLPSSKRLLSDWFGFATINIGPEDSNVPEVVHPLLLFTAIGQPRIMNQVCAKEYSLHQLLVKASGGDQRMPQSDLMLRAMPRSWLLLPNNMALLLHSNFHRKLKS